MPIWNGEIGAHTSTWVAGQIKLFEDPANGICGWIFWPWKRAAEGMDDFFKATNVALRLWHCG